MTKAELIDVIEDLYPLALCHSVAYASSKAYGCGKVHPDHMKFIANAQHVIDNKRAILDCED